MRAGKKGEGFRVCALEFHYRALIVRRLPYVYHMRTLIIRIPFGGPFFYTYKKEPPK